MASFPALFVSGPRLVHRHRQRGGVGCFGDARRDVRVATPAGLASVDVVYEPFRFSQVVRSSPEDGGRSVVNRERGAMVWY